MRKREWEPINPHICLLCNGVSCKHCGLNSFSHHKVTFPPIKGMHCDFVGENKEVLATQRPSSRIIKEFKITDQFIKNNIKAIFNLQEAGEHPLCGDKINESGFSYFPEEFTDQGILFYSAPWPDMTAPSLSIIHNCVQIMASLMKKEKGAKIAVHCHAGLGRTGMIIACLFVYLHGYSSEHAINVVRRDRPGTIQRVSQVKAINEYEWFLKQANVMYAAIKGDRTFTCEEYLNRQNVSLSGSAKDVTSHTPKLLNIIFNKLLTSVTADAERVRVIMAFIHPGGGEESKWSLRENSIQEYRLQLHYGELDVLNKEADMSVVAQLCLDWLEHLKEPILPESFLQGASNSLHVQKDVCFLFAENLNSTLDERKLKMFATNLLDQCDLQDLPISNFRTLSLILNFFRMLMLGKTQDETFDRSDKVLVSTFQLRKVSMRLAVALMQLNASCVKRCRPVDDGVEEVKDKKDIAISKVSKFIGIDLHEKLKKADKPIIIRSPSPGISRIESDPSKIIKSRFFIADEIEFCNPQYKIYGRFVAFLLQNWTADLKNSYESKRSKSNEGEYEYTPTGTPIRSNPGTPARSESPLAGEEIVNLTSFNPFENNIIDIPPPLPIKSVKNESNSAPVIPKPKPSPKKDIKNEKDIFEAKKDKEEMDDPFKVPSSKKKSDLDDFDPFA